MNSPNRRIRKRAILVVFALAIAALAILLSGCGSGDHGRDGSGAAGDQANGSSQPSRPSQAGDPPPRAEPDTAQPPLPAAFSCPDDGSNCATARGRILYVEAVDPDGDGDAHFALASDESVTLPGVSVIDVAISLRPDPLPEPGDTMSAIGPVYTGSYGQRQIEATAIRYRRSASGRD